MEIRGEGFFENPADTFLESFEKALGEASSGHAQTSLSERFLVEVSGKAGVSGEDLAGLLRLAGSLRDDPPLEAALRALQLLLSGPDPIKAASLPRFAGRLAEVEEMANLLLAVSRIPMMEAVHEARGIPADIRRDTVSDLPLWLGKLHGESGRRGLSRRILQWLEFHTAGRLYRIGRLQFVPGEFRYPCEVYRRGANASVVALASGGTMVDADGFVAEDAAKSPWTSSLSVSGREMKGFPIDPSGRVSKRMLTLDGRVWEKALQDGEAVLDTHIPEDGPLGVEACRDSFARAIPFFKEHFPEIDSKAFVCSTWLFDPCFLEILKPSSNVMSFYKEFYCVPLKGHSVCTGETLWRVFGKDKDRLEEAPKDTSMKRVIYGHYKKGGAFRESGGFILNADIDAYGSQRYWSLTQVRQR